MCPGYGLHRLKGDLKEVAKGLGTTRKTLSAIVNGRQGVTPGMAIKLATGLGSTPEFWLREQENYDLFQTRMKVDTGHIRVFWKNAVAVL